MKKTTPLGRVVPVDDWKAFQGDVALKMLLDYADALPGEKDCSLSMSSIVNGSAMMSEEVVEVCVYLADKGFVCIHGQAVHLTPEGAEFAKDCLDWQDARSESNETAVSLGLGMSPELQDALDAWRGLTEKERAVFYKLFCQMFGDTPDLQSGLFALRLLKAAAIEKRGTAHEASPKPEATAPCSCTVTRHERQENRACPVHFPVRR